MRTDLVEKGATLTTSQIEQDLIEETYTLIDTEQSLKIVTTFLPMPKNRCKVTVITTHFSPKNLTNIPKFKQA